MKAITIIASTVAALAMGAIGFTYAQSNVTPGGTDSTITQPGSSAPGSTTGSSGSMDSNRSTMPGSTSADTMPNERLARADRN